VTIGDALRRGAALSLKQLLESEAEGQEAVDLIHKKVALFENLMTPLIKRCNLLCRMSFKG